MTSLDDLKYMPFVSHQHADGVVEVAVDDAISLFMQTLTRSKEDTSMLHTTVMISAVEARSIARS